MDFYYNGKKLSDFGGFVGSSDGGFKRYTLLPSREYITDRPLYSNIETVYNAYFNARVFTVPVVFESLSDGDIRKLSAWLKSLTPSKFYFVNDSVYINAVLDADAFDITTVGGCDGQVELKFICHDPYFYALNKINVEYKPLVSGQKYKLINRGSEDAYPYIEIRGSGTIRIDIYSDNGTLYSTSTINNVTAGVVVDSFLNDCKTVSGGNLLNNINDFPVIPAGDFEIKITGTLTSMKLSYTERYI